MERNHLEFVFLQIIRQYRVIGYGNMMHIISREWYLDLENKYGPGTGAGTFVAGQTLGLLPESEQAEFVAAIEADPLFQRDRL